MFHFGGGGGGARICAGPAGGGSGGGGGGFLELPATADFTLTASTFATAEDRRTGLCAAGPFVAWCWGGGWAGPPRADLPGSWHDPDLVRDLPLSLSLSLKFESSMVDCDGERRVLRFLSSS